MKILVSWSTGKDSAWMLHELNRQHPGGAAGLLTTTNQAFDRVAVHAVRRELLEAQAAAAGLPLHVVPLPWPCSNEQYEAIMKDAVAGFVRDGYTHAAFIVDRLDDILAWAAERGVVNTEGPVNWGRRITCFLRDPDGNVLEFNELIEDSKA